jgi:hypothetical protein
LGNRGTIAPGDIQWMTAGSGIVHQEMPKGDGVGRMHGFQLWANLPSSLKMTAPHYQEVKSAEIPDVTDDDGTRARVICGNLWGTAGPVDGIAAEPNYFDISVPPGKRKTIPVATTRHAFAYIFDGSGTFGNASPSGPVDDRSLVLFDSGDEVTVQAGEQGIRFLLVSGKPLGQPVAWYGPIVMNTQEELKEAFAEFQDGTFLKHGKAPRT